jgi:epoxyqueuosine reductase QueG
MEVTKEQLVRFALEQGFDDIRFVRADDMTERKDLKQPHALLDSAACIVVLFAAYRPAGSAPPGHMALSAYYAVSHASYHAARAVADYLKQHGADALHTTAINAKEAALRTGGFLGDNGFYYHPSFGSFVCIQTVLTNLCEPLVYQKDDMQCLHCGACAAACPPNAVGDIQSCLRYHINGTVPEALRSDVYQLLGCEKCQTACPLNDDAQSEPVHFSLEEILSGGATAQLRGIAGPNMVRRGRLISQAALYAAATEQKQLLNRLKLLAENEAEPIRTHALWAIDKLSGEDK